MIKTNHFILTLVLAVSKGLSQTAPISTDIVTAEPAANPTLPPYIVYRHFLAWVNQLDQAAKTSGEGDVYKFSEPFSRANLQHQHLDVLREAAHRLDTDLQKHHARAQLVIARYRKEAKDALAQGQPLPPPPPEIHDLERQRTALLINHYMTLRAALGSDVSAQLDAYLGYEFTPHIKLRPVTTPGAPVPAQVGN